MGSPEEQDAQIAQMVDGIFSQADTDGDGCLSKDEIREFGKAQGQPDNEAELEEQFAAMDTNADGKISKEEFTAFLKQMFGQLNEAMGQM